MKKYYTIYILSLVFGLMILGIGSYYYLEKYQTATLSLNTKEIYSIYIYSYIVILLAFISFAISLGAIILIKKYSIFNKPLTTNLLLTVSMLCVSFSGFQLISQLPTTYASYRMQNAHNGEKENDILWPGFENIQPDK